MQSLTKMRQRQKRKRENAEQQLTSLYNQQETKRKSKSLRDNSDVKNVTASVTDENAPVKLEALSQLSADNKLLHNVIIKDEKLKTADSETTDTDSDDDDQGVSRYERLRLRNIQDNQQFLAQLGVYESKERVRQAFTTPKRLASQRGLKEPRSSKPVLTRRHSLRISRHSPEGNPLPPLPDPVAEIEEHLRPPAGPLNLVDYLYGAGADEDFLVKFTNRMKCLGTTTKTDISHDTFASVAKQMKSLRLAGVAKVVPSRSFSVAIHPTCKKIVVASGGKWGTVGIWDQSAQDDRMGFMAFSPHSRPVCCLAFSSFNPSCLFSCSYDGSLRCTHIDKGICDEIYSVPEDDGVLLRNLDFVDDSTLLVSQGDGRVALVDTRTEGANAEHTYQLHNKSLRSVSVHPLERHYFCTSSVDGYVCIWDRRKIKTGSGKNTAIDNLPHPRMLDAAYFSPITGKYILTTCMDNKINIYDSSTLTDIKLLKAIRHDNHVGRWLSKFRATWHPSREDIFVVGSMNRPRQIELYSDTGAILHTLKNPDLNSVCSVNAIHPTLHVVVGANSSGRVHVFKPA